MADKKQPTCEGCFFLDNNGYTKGCINPKNDNKKHPYKFLSNRYFPEMPAWCKGRLSEWTVIGFYVAVIILFVSLNVLVFQ